MKKIFLFLFVSGVLAACLCSCTPSACFVINQDYDSIYVGKPVTFDAGCSQKAAEYFWEFNSTFDSTIYYNKAFTKTFTDTGDVRVNLVVVNGNKTGSASKSFHVRP